MGRNESKAASEQDVAFAAKAGDQSSELSDGQLESVAGGMIEIEMNWDPGMDIQCPQCGSYNISFTGGSNNYDYVRCGDCKTEFMVRYPYGKGSPWITC